jgi:Flp pilus assembly protein TadD
MRRGMTGRARTEFEEAIASRPTDPTPHWNFGVALVDVGKPDLAVPHLETALRIDPRCGPAAAELGRAHARAGRRPEALAAFARAESLGVSSPTFWQNFGIELLAAGRAGDAATRLERSVLQDSTRAASWSQLGVAQAGANRLEPARQALERAHRLAPHDEDTRFNLAQVLVRLERHAEVDALLQERPPQRADLLATWGLSARAQGDHPRAIRLLRQATERAPRDAAIWNNYGVVLAEHGDTPGAIAVWRQILRFAPDNATARANLAARGVTVSKED